VRSSKSKAKSSKQAKKWDSGPIFCFKRKCKIFQEFIREADTYFELFALVFEN